MRKAPPRTLDSLQVGETGYIDAAALRVDADMECWLPRRAEVQAAADYFHCLRVTRKKDGYHVAVMAPHQWEPKPLQSAEGWAPVESVVEDYDPAVDYRSAL